MPQRVIAQSYCAACSGIFAGHDPDERRSQALHRKYVTMLDIYAGGMSARPDKDGINAIRVHVGNTGSQPIELMRVEEWSIAPDTGGAGRWRGGCASTRVYRVLFEEATCTVSGERGRVAPDSVFGGLPGALFMGRIDHAGGGASMLPAFQTARSDGRSSRARPADGGAWDLADCAGG